MAPTFAKCILNAAVSEATHGCKDDQICAFLKSGIDNSVHRVQYIWEDNSTKKNWGILIVDANTVFSKISQIGMMWTVFHL